MINKDSKYSNNVATGKRYSNILLMVSDENLANNISVDKDYFVQVNSANGIKTFLSNK